MRGQGGQPWHPCVAHDAKLCPCVRMTQPGAAHLGPRARGGGGCAVRVGPEWGWWCRQGSVGDCLTQHLPQLLLPNLSDQLQAGWCRYGSVAPLVLTPPGALRGHQLALASQTLGWNGKCHLHHVTGSSPANDVHAGMQPLTWTSHETGGRYLHGGRSTGGVGVGVRGPAQAQGRATACNVQSVVAGEKEGVGRRIGRARRGPLRGNTRNNPRLALPMDRGKTYTAVHLQPLQRARPAHHQLQGNCMPHRHAPEDKKTKP